MLYVFECSGCKLEFEQKRKLGDTKGVKCPECDNDCSVVIQVNGFLLRGFGWDKGNH